MAENGDFPKTLEEAKKLGLTVFKRTERDATVMFQAETRPCSKLTLDDWCQKTNPRPDGSQTICYCDENKQCNNCVIYKGTNN